MWSYVLLGVAVWGFAGLGVVAMMPEKPGLRGRVPRWLFRVIVLLLGPWVWFVAATGSAGKKEGGV